MGLPIKIDDENRSKVMNGGENDETVYVSNSRVDTNFVPEGIFDEI